MYYFSLADEEKNAAAQGFMGKVTIVTCIHSEIFLMNFVTQIYAEGSEDVPASSDTALEYFKGAAKKVNLIISPTSCIASLLLYRVILLASVGWG